MIRLLLLQGILISALMMKSNKIETNDPTSQIPHKVSELKAKLGEGSIWDPNKQVLYWIDIEDGLLFEYNPLTKLTLTHKAGKKIGTIVPETNKTVILALQDGVYRMFLENDSLEFIAKPSSLLDNQRFNDGKCDPDGRFWLGSIGPKNTCFLYKLDNDGTIAEMLDNITTSNGITWSLDSKKMYYIDTNSGKVRQFDYDLKNGTISNEKTIVEIPGNIGYPDGMTIDSEGKLWVALWSGSAVHRYDPETGELLQKISVPAKNVTSCAFGGKDLDELYITCASIGMSDEEALKLPDAGKLFVIKPGVKGVKANFFKIRK